MPVLQLKTGSSHPGPHLHSQFLYVIGVALVVPEFVASGLKKYKNLWSAMK